PEQYIKYFDLDGVDEVDLEMIGLLPPEQPLTQSIPRFLSNCIHEPYFLQVSYDDDKGAGWPAMDVPVTVPSPSGQTHGTTLRRDEVVGVNLAVGVPPLLIKRIFPVADEIRVHQNMKPNPDLIERHDDDVDGLDVVWSPDACPVRLFSADHEASMGLDPGDIYEVTPGGPIRVVDAQKHLGLAQGTDVDAFEFTWLPLPLVAGEYLALVFSVNDDDPLTANVNESGGLNPNMIYYSFLNGTNAPLLTRPLEDDIDAISISPKCLGDTIGQAKKLPIGSQVVLSGKVVTSNMMNRPDFRMFYIEEEDRSSGIGVSPVMDTPPDVNVGDLVCLFGTTFLNQGTELIFLAEEATSDGLTEFLVAPGMMNRSTGGERFGEQPGVCNDALSNPRLWSTAMNNVGSLVKTFGRVTSVMPTLKVIWINDGTDLKDGTFSPSGDGNIGVAVLLPPSMTGPPSVGSFLSVTGEMLAVPGGTIGDIYGIRLLVPRDSADIVDLLAP
ncbi:MAG: hypothetical protein WCL39_09820, partial [Armatimonadota bacterium]